MKPEWIAGNKYSSDYRFSFSKNVRLLKVAGPLSHGGLWKYRGWSVIVWATDVNNDTFSSYRQDFEHWGQAFIRATYYRIYKLWHNLRYH